MISTPAANGQSTIAKHQETPLIRADRDPAALAFLMRPSEYTAALVHAIERRSVARPPGRVIDVGVGSGVLLAVLASLGATDLWGIDIDPSAVEVATRALRRDANGRTVTVVQGDLWNDIPDIRFDTVVANLPHFPAGFAPSPGRNPTWSGGGRTLLDRFIDGLPAHLTVGGVAWITHHALVGLDRTRSRLASLGLSSEAIATWTVYEPEDRVRALSLDQVDDLTTLRQFGGYYFANAHILEIRA